MAFLLAGLPDRSATLRHTNCFCSRASGRAVCGVCGASLPNQTMSGQLPPQNASTASLDAFLQLLDREAAAKPEAEQSPELLALRAGLNGIHQHQLQPTNEGVAAAGSGASGGLPLPVSASCTQFQAPDALGCWLLLFT